ncbi:MAG: hypothetical protein R2695_19050 [Acidimicrobiales bacterium]
MGDSIALAAKVDFAALPGVEVEAAAEVVQRLKAQLAALEAQTAGRTRRRCGGAPELIVRRPRRYGIVAGCGAPRPEGSWPWRGRCGRCRAPGWPWLMV